MPQENHKMPQENSKKSPRIFECKICDYKSSKKRDYERHILTRKHKILTEAYEQQQRALITLYKCGCGKEYKHRQSLHNHKKKCIYATEEDQEETENIETPKVEKKREPIIDGEVMTEREKMLFEILDKQTQKIAEDNIKLQEQNIKLQEQHLKFQEESLKFQEEQNKTNNTLLTAVEEGKLGNTTNNTNNNQFNLNVFLNDKCKNALNITDFLESLQLQLQDLEETGRLGHVNGISRIFVNALKNMDETERPIHCTDSKRETLYIKNDDKWTKDDNKEKLKSAIDSVTNKNVEQIPQWQMENPKCMDMESRENAELTQITLNSLGPGDKEEYDKNNDKIARNIIKQVVVDK